MNLRNKLNSHFQRFSTPTTDYSTSCWCRNYLTNAKIFKSCWQFLSTTTPEMKTHNCVFLKNLFQNNNTNLSFSGNCSKVLIVFGKSFI
jgi:hypothetical protein